MRRKLDLFLCPPKVSIVDDVGSGTLKFEGDYCAEKVVVLGEEHRETLPGGEKAAVGNERVFSFDFPKLTKGGFVRKNWPFFRVK